MFLHSVNWNAMYRCLDSYRSFAIIFLMNVFRSFSLQISLDTNTCTIVFYSSFMFLEYKEFI